MVRFPAQCETFLFLPLIFVCSKICLPFDFYVTTEARFGWNFFIGIMPPRSRFSFFRAFFYVEDPQVRSPPSVVVWLVLLRLLLRHVFPVLSSKCGISTGVLCLERKSFDPSPSSQLVSFCVVSGLL